MTSRRINHEKDSKKLRSLIAWKKRLNIAFWVLIIIAVAEAFIACVASTSVDVPGMFILIGTAVAFALLMQIGKMIITGRQKKIAANYARHVLEDSMDSLETYSKKKGVDKSLVKKEFGFPYYDDVGGLTDLVEGVLHGIRVTFSQFNLQESRSATDSDGDTSTTWYVKFEGTMFVLEHPFALQSDVMLTQYKTFEDRILTGSERFDDTFTVAADDRSGASYSKILTPSYMEKLMKVSDKFGARFAMRFQKDGTFLLVVKDMDLFEAGDTLDGEALHTRIEKEMDDVAFILDTLKV